MKYSERKFHSVSFPLGGNLVTFSHGAETGIILSFLVNFMKVFIDIYGRNCCQIKKRSRAACEGH